MDTVYSIPSHRMSDFNARIKKIERKAAQLGCAAPVVTLGRILDIPIRDQNGMPTLQYYHAQQVTVTGEAPTLNGWTVVAAIDHLHGGEANVIRGDAPKKYRTAEGNCEHCNHKRARNTTYVLVQGDRTMQVGSTCLADFTGIHDPIKAAELCGIYHDLGDFDDDGTDRGGGCRSIPALLGYVACAAMSIRTDGWVSKGAAYDGYGTATAMIATMLIADRVKPTPADIATAEAAIAWARDIDPETESDYLHNLRAVCQREAVADQHQGIAASVVAAHTRIQEREHEAAIESTSEYFGSVKVRSLYRLRLISVIVIDGHYGISFLHKFRDCAGNVAIWFGSRRAEIDGYEIKVGALHYVKGTVKEHSEFKGVKQTTLTRCTIMTQPKKKAGSR
jgi:hypothetical protein